MNTDNNIYLSNDIIDPMMIAIDESKNGVASGDGGPFGAVIVRFNEVNNNYEVVSKAHNMVLKTNDPTAHAEVMAIRKASSTLNRFDLSDCLIYSTCQPCPMCYGAIHWAKIPQCIYATTSKDAAAAGFDDQFIYDAIRNTSESKCNFIYKFNEEAKKTFHNKYKIY